MTKPQAKPTPIQVLLDDHKRIRGLFRQLEAFEKHEPAETHEMKAGVMRELAMELEIHALVEEELFYPALQNRGNSHQAALVEAGIEQHRAVDELLDRLDRARGAERGINDVLDELILQFSEHLDTEEHELFPIAEGLGPEVARRILDRRRELLDSPRYRDARPEIVQDPNGGEQIRHVEGKRAS